MLSCCSRRTWGVGRGKGTLSSVVAKGCTPTRNYCIYCWSTTFSHSSIHAVYIFESQGGTHLLASWNSTPILLLTFYVKAAVLWTGECYQFSLSKFLEHTKKVTRSLQLIIVAICRKICSAQRDTGVLLSDYQSKSSRSWTTYFRPETHHSSIPSEEHKQNSVKNGKSPLVGHRLVPFKWFLADFMVICKNLDQSNCEKWYTWLEWMKKVYIRLETDRIQPVRPDWPRNNRIVKAVWAG